MCYLHYHFLGWVVGSGGARGFGTWSGGEWHVAPTGIPMGVPPVRECHNGSTRGDVTPLRDGTRGGPPPAPLPTPLDVREGKSRHWLVSSLVLYCSYHTQLV